MLSEKKNVSWEFMFCRLISDIAGIKWPFMLTQVYSEENDGDDGSGISLWITCVKEYSA